MHGWKLKCIQTTQIACIEHKRKGVFRVTQWHYVDANGQPAGPISTEALLQLRKQGLIQADGLVWREGMPEWRPMHDVDAAEWAAPDQAANKSYTGAPPEYTAAQQKGLATGHVVYAGFWRRWAALFLDQLILGIAFYAVLFVLIVVVVLVGSISTSDFNSEDPPGWLVTAYLGFLLLYYAAAALYFSLSESSKHQATLGKRAVGIKVVNAQGGRLSFSHALARWCSAGLSYITLYVGFLMAAFTDRKRALHDMVAGTLVVDRWAYTDTPERQQEGLGGCLVVFIIGIIGLVMVMVLAILAAIALPAYQQYQQRAEVGVALVEVSAVKNAVTDYRDAEGACITTDAIEPNVQAMIAQSPHLSEVIIGRFESGNCGLEATLGGFQADSLNTHKIWWEQLSETEWECTSDLDDKLLPEVCRG